MVEPRVEPGVEPTMSEEEEALGDLFVGVLPALRLHLENKLEDCLCCGQKVSLQALEERIQLAEQYVDQAMESRRARRDQRARVTGMSFAQEHDVLLAGQWTEQQITRMSQATRLLILKNKLQGNRFSVRKDGSLFDTVKGRAVTE